MADDQQNQNQHQLHYLLIPVCCTSIELKGLSLFDWFDCSSRFYCIRLIVLALHDASDVFMETAKVLKYSEKELAASVLLVGFFALSWFILRLMFFSFWVIRNTSYEKAYPTFLYYIFITMLMTSLMFNIYDILGDSHILDVHETFEK